MRSNVVETTWEAAARVRRQVPLLVQAFEQQQQQQQLQRQLEDDAEAMEEEGANRFFTRALRELRAPPQPRTWRGAIQRVNRHRNLQTERTNHHVILGHYLPHHRADRRHPRLRRNRRHRRGHCEDHLRGVSRVVRRLIRHGTQGAARVAAC